MAAWLKDDTAVPSLVSWLSGRSRRFFSSFFTQRQGQVFTAHQRRKEKICESYYSFLFSVYYHFLETMARLVPATPIAVGV